MKIRNFIPTLPFEQSSLSTVLSGFHQRHIDLHDYWSIKATKRKIVGSFWLQSIESYLILLSWAALFFACFSSQLSGLNAWSVILFYGLILYLPVAITLYLPYFYFDFLPRLESEIDHLTNQHSQGIQKCKKEQYSVLTLMLIQHVYQQLAQIKTQGIAEPYMKLMVNQYGISQKSIDASLRIIILKQWDRSKERKRTEITDAFNDAKSYFSSLELFAGTDILEQLQLKILR
jgi:hypothetical protein